MNPRTRTLSLGAVAAATVLGAAVLLLRPTPQQPASPLLRPDDARLVELGARIYYAQCAACHGERLEGQPNWRERGPDGLLPAPPHDASGHTWHHPDELLFRITKLGMARAANMPDYRSAMPAYEGVLNDEEIVAVLSWIKSRWPAPIRKEHDQINAQHRESRGE